MVLLAFKCSNNSVDKFLFVVKFRTTGYNNKTVSEDTAAFYDFIIHTFLVYIWEKLYVFIKLILFAFL